MCTSLLASTQTLQSLKALRVRATRKINLLNSRHACVGGRCSSMLANMSCGFSRRSLHWVEFSSRWHQTPTLCQTVQSLCCVKQVCCPPMLDFVHEAVCRPFTSALVLPLFSSLDSLGYFCHIEQSVNDWRLKDKVVRPLNQSTIILQIPCLRIS